MQDKEILIKEKFRALGKIASLWSQSSFHQKRNIQFMSDFIVPPVELDQYLLIEKKGLPVAYCSWAYLDEKEELEYIKSSFRLALESWNKGDRLWLIDWIAPFGKKHSFEMKSQLNNKFKNTFARAIRIKNNSNVIRIKNFISASANTEVTNKKIQEYNKQLAEKLKQISTK